ncbi:hypothetical protein GF362_02585 [Candidatus Dojkabacteria bacterium]|nr:hypothetical protein [Candidatus Dojkabacteria bacterium]
MVIITYLIFFSAFHFLSRNNFINKNTRLFFLKSRIFRRLLILNEYGDARFDYLSPDKSKVFVEVDYQLGYAPEIDLETVLTDIMTQLLDKQVEVKITQDKELPDLREFEDKHIIQILQETQNYTENSEQSYLHLLYLSKSAEQPDNTGLVLGSNDLIIFKETINELTERPELIKRIEESTIKHEFGHLLGVEHIEREDCIMSEYVEVLGNYKFQKNNIPTQYCGDTIVQIEDYKSML